MGLPPAINVSTGPARRESPVFLPVSFLIMLGGGVKMIYDFSVYHHIGSLDVIIFMSGILVILVGLLADLIVVVSRKLGDAKPPQS